MAGEAFICFEVEDLAVWEFTFKGEQALPWSRQKRRTTELQVVDVVRKKPQQLRTVISEMAMTHSRIGDGTRIAAAQWTLDLRAQGAFLGVKHQRLTNKSLREAIVDSIVWADASHFPFVQFVTGMHKGGAVFYCKATRGIEMGQVMLKSMEEVKKWLSHMTHGLIILKTLPSKEEVKAIEPGG
ncbi:hypothetical protein SELMODRAFT_431414 [Selaginella moellendorffii]|uniref:Uncharacterized protein n=1 Tax=Selaginella moellendorffii TaxID=88036 RepID=D8TCJ6_SELML|nr:hypothetical protein SELMODRAFT_431414 [Selaginella moellendorffii]